MIGALIVLIVTSLLAWLAWFLVEWVHAPMEWELWDVFDDDEEGEVR